MATQLRVVELEQELKQVHAASAADKKKLEDELAEEKRETQELMRSSTPQVSVGSKSCVICCFV
jgi:hypothetical protein